MNTAPINKISAFQLAGTFVLSRMFAEAMSFPLNNAEYSMSKFSAVLVAKLIILAMFIPLLIFANEHADDNIISAAKRKSPVFAWIIGICLIMYLLFMFAIILSRFEYYATSTTLGDAPALFIVCAISFVAAYAMWKGVETIVRIATGIAFIFVIYTITVTCSVSSSFHLDFLYPALIENGSVFINQVTEEIAKNAEVVFFGILLNFVRVKPQRAIYISLPAILILTELIIFVETVVFGPYLSKLNFPLFVAAALSDIVIFQRLDGFDVVVWLLATIVRLSLCGVCAKIIMTELLGYKAKKLSVIIFTVLGAAFSLILAQNLNLLKALYNIKGIVLAIFIGGTIIPLIVLLMSRAKAKPQSSQQQ